MKKTTLMTILFVCLVAISAGAEDKIADRLAKFYPNFKPESINKTPLKDIYEVSTGGNIMYFHTDGYIIFGEIFNKEGKNITAERRDAMAGKKLKDIPINNAIKIGEGKNTVIEFSDPDCPYCRKASQHLSEKKDITKYVFLIPLRQLHPDSEKKIKYIICSSDQAQAYKDAFDGKLDGKDLSISKECEEKAEAKLKGFEDVAQKAGVSGTPVFWVNNKHISGANIPAIDDALKGGKK